VATNYVNLRTTEKRIRYAEKNIKLQETTLRLVKARFEGGQVNKVGVYQTESLLRQTEAGIHELEISLRQFNNQLCTLLGIPPEELRAKIGTMPPVDELEKKDGKSTIRIPRAPEPDEVAVGIPANLLRRRPDVRRAERLAAAQCAQIGIAEAEFYPHFYINGVVQTSASQFRDLFRPQAFNGTVGPTFQWNILNYGRIINNVRLQDATFLQLVAAYQQTVLSAQQDVENGLVTYLQAKQRFNKQAQSVHAAEEASKLVLEQFNAGIVNIAQLILFQQNLVQQQDTLAIAEGEIDLGLIQVFRALGGGWELRTTGCDPHEGPVQMEAPGDDRPVQFGPIAPEKIGPPTKVK
jgi:outer membrane protein TolC